MDNVIEGNKLIAEFMGMRCTNKNYPYVFRDETKEIGKTLLGAYCENMDYDYLKYHSSWDWLMPVCKHIIKMYSDKRERIFFGLHRVDIDLTWQAVVDFITFWNDPESEIDVWTNVPSPYDPMPKGKITAPKRLS